MADWNEVALADAASWLSGGTPKTSEESYWGGDIPWISAASLRNFYIHDSERNVTELGANNGTRLVPKDTILFVVRGMSLKTEFRMGISCRTVAFGQDCKALTPRPGIDPLFLAYAIKAMTPEILGLVDEAGHGTGRLQTELLGKLQVRYPDAIDQQRKAIAPLQALDDKIAVNERIVEKLDQLTHGLFDYRFAAAGSGAVDDWRSGRLDELCTTQYGYTAKAEEAQVGPRFLRVKDINKKNWIIWDSVPHCPISDRDRSKYTLKVGDIVVARMADPGKSAIIEEPTDSVFASYLVRLQTESIAHAYFVWGFLKSEEYARYSESARSGSVQSNMNAKVITGVELKIPPQDLMQEHAQRISPIRKRLLATLRENAALAAMRDTLLPQLMSGKLRVRDAERIVEDAV